MESGTSGSYHWIQFGNDPPWEGQIILPDIWQNLRDVLLGRYLVNISFDSGLLIPHCTDEYWQSLATAGWRACGDFACSPKLTTLTEIPHDCYEEWWVFDEPVGSINVEPIVNYNLGFNNTEALEFLAPAFWERVHHFQPFLILGENSSAFFISRDQEILLRIAITLEGLHSGGAP